MTHLEYATGGRPSGRFSPFRPEWGVPPADENERAAWLKGHCRREMETRAAQGSANRYYGNPYYAELAAADARLAGMLRRALLDRKRTP